jgi:integron integrase
VLTRLRTELRARHYSLRTEQAYEHWMRRFVTFHGLKSLQELGPEAVKEYLEYIAVERKVAASTQNQALNGLVFLYKHTLGEPIALIGDFTRAKRPKRLPVVLTRAEVGRLLEALTGTYRLMAGLLYGSGLRLMESVRLRVKDVDFAHNQIMVGDGKGQKDRVTILPQRFQLPLRAHLERVKEQHENDLAQGLGAVYLWPALERKYPSAAREWIWQYVFLSGRLSVDSRSGLVRRHYIHENALQRAVKEAAVQVGLTK